MNRTNSKQKLHQNANNNTITVSVQIHSKTVSIKAPLPCPASTLREIILQELQSIQSKIAYFETINQDYITDYKLQMGVGWVRGNCQLRCILRKKGEDFPTGIEAYSVLKCVGVGGFSKVYLVRDRSEGTFYAAKFI